MDVEKAHLFKAEKLENLLVFKANYKNFQFRRHVHEDFSLGLMHQGTQKFYCRGKDIYVPTGHLITVNADEIHDGMSADGNLYHYHVIFIPQEVMQSIAEETLATKTSFYFKNPVTHDRELADQLHYFFRLLDNPSKDTLEIQSLFYTVVTKLIQRHGVESMRDNLSERIPEAVNRACEYINDLALSDITLDDISRAAGLSRYHFLRTFNSSMGITPHAYLLQRRLHLARESIRGGAEIIDAALDCRFADQSHFSRRFKAAFGITPKQYKYAVR